MFSRIPTARSLFADQIRNSCRLTYSIGMHQRPRLTLQCVVSSLGFHFFHFFLYLLKFHLIVINISIESFQYLNLREINIFLHFYTILSTQSRHGVIVSYNRNHLRRSQDFLVIVIAGFRTNHNRNRLRNHPASGTQHYHDLSDCCNRSVAS